MSEASTPNPAADDWRPKGECPIGYFKVKPEVLATPAAEAVRPQRSVTFTPTARPAVHSKVKPISIALAPIPQVDLGSDFVIVICMVRSDLDKRQTGLWRAATE